MTMLERDLLRKAVMGGVTASCGSVDTLAVLGLLAIGGGDMMRGGGDSDLALPGWLGLERGSSSIAPRD